jgi:hypothetical protein
MGGRMATRSRLNRPEISESVARAREIFAKYDLDRAHPTGDFNPSATIEGEFDRLLKKLS